MPLPKADLPRYKHTLVGLNKSISYRPFTLKEQKILLLAKESEELSQQAEAIKQILELCTFGEIQSSQLAFFDIEDLFLRIRAKSASEIAEMSYRDKETNDIYNIKINLDEVKVTIPEGHTKKIEISDNLGIMMKYPTLELITKREAEDIPEDELIKECIDYVYDSTSVYYFKDQTKEEVDEWMDSLDSHTLLKIQKFFQTMPRLRHEVTLKLKNGKEETLKFEGLQSFFI